MNLQPDVIRYTPSATNLAGCLRHWAECRATQPAFQFLDEQDEFTQMTYSELDRQARAIASKLTAMDLKGERALLFFPPGLDFIAAFFGCLYAGTTAVPAFPPRRNRNMARVEAISEDARAAVVLTVHDVIDRSAKLLDDDAQHLKKIPWVAVDRVSLDAADSWVPTELKNELAVLQYTSGSTGQPKGVMLTHANLMHNCSLITHGFEADQDSIALFWLPTYHDMGLVGGILNPMFIGCPNVFMSPMSFLQKPIRWLRNISRFRVTISGGPDFAYALCNEKITEADCEGLDLSSWKVAFDGAEPVRATTLARFAEKFQPFGFRTEAFYPCYGMAESTLIVTGAERQEIPVVGTFDTHELEMNKVVPVEPNDNSARELVSSGRVLPGQQVLIVDPETCLRLPKNRVGEIWAQSGSVAAGYWNNDQATKHAFGGQLADQDQQNDSFLRTGDLGFFHNDQLFVTGRSKDLIIINGRNLYPHDIESIVENAHEAIRVGGGVAFSANAEGVEQLVIAQELVREYRKFDTAEITAAIRKAVFEVLDVAPHSIVLLKIGKLPKTSSGKVQRRACCDKYLAGELDALAQWQLGVETTSNHSAVIPAPDSHPTETHSQESIQSWMVDRIAKHLKTSPEKIDVDETFAYFGLDSLTLVGISGELESWLGFAVSPKLLFNYPTISELSEHLAASSLANTRSDTALTTQPTTQPSTRPSKPASSPVLNSSNQSAAEMLANLDNLSPEQTKAILRRLVEEKAREEFTTHPMSHGQKALWFIYQMDRTSSAYNLMYATQVRADLDRDAFCRAAQTVINRHGTLRTTYSAVDGLPTTTVHEFQEFSLTTIDARHWSQQEFDGKIQAFADAPFDLEHGPVLRVHLLERTGNQHTILFTAHHLALDFWAFDLLLNELESFYRQETTGKQASVSAINSTFNDFVDWQAQDLKGPAGDRQWEYWSQQLSGDLPVLDLPTDRPRVPVQSFRGSSVPINIPPQLTKSLIELSKSEGVTLFATFLAAFQVLLYRYSGQADVLVGCPTSGRSRSEFVNVLGYFANPIVLRANLAGEQSFASFLQQVRETLVDGISNQDFPFPLLVERLKTPRDASRSPIFQVAIGWETPLRPNTNESLTHDSNGQPLPPGSLGLKPLAFGQQGSAFDLTLALVNRGDVVSGTFQYNEDLFDRSTITELGKHFQTILGSIAEEPNCSLSDLPLMEPDEQRRLIEDNNVTATEFPRESCLHELFEAQVVRTPNSVALEFNGEPLTYRQLNERANQVAHRLIELGVGPDGLVGVCVDRSLELMVGLLGILKAGGAYVPLAPGTPRQRLTAMLDLCQTPIVLTQAKLANELPEACDQVYCLDSDWSSFANQKVSDPGRRGASSNLAYVIFTSGSTGKPKGVQVEHRSVVNFLSSMKNEPGIGSTDVLLAVTTITFDISVLELFLPLIVGSKVVVVCPGIAADGVQLAQLIEEKNTTIMQATPSTWRLLVEAGWQGDRSLRILCGGEAMPPDLADMLLERCGSLWNMYGPTETTIWSTIDRVEVRSDPMPIGRPIANTRIYILDKLLRPVPRGVKGDLYIGGSGLARGYVGQPELTDERFVADPFCGEAGARMYKTGDLVRFRSDGEIEFLGRRDFQVKVRGFRIELGEIESHLAGHPNIRQAIVVASNSGTTVNERQLVAYFTSHNDASSTSDLRDFLKRNLPDYMVPSIFVPLEEIPLNSAGKVDRAALPKPDTSRPALRVPFVAPRNETENKLAKTWARVLGLDEIGIHDNFFELGGASMQSLEIVALAGELGIEMLPALLFQYPTIAGLVSSGLLQISDVAAETVGPIGHANQPEVSLHPPAIDAEPKPRLNSATEKSNVVIESIGVYLPEKSVSTRDVVANCKHKVSFPLEDMTGIKSRRMAADDEFTSDIASQAVEECLNNSKYSTDQIDLVICCHIGRDEEPNSAAIEPGTAMHLKHRFEFPNAVAFDINNACAGMFTGIHIAESYLNSGAASRVMVVSAEHISPVMTTAQQEISGFIDPRIACLTLGDAGAAIILESDPENKFGFQELEMYTLSQYSSMCIGRPTEHVHGGPILVVPDPIKHTTIAIENSIAHSKLVLDRSDWDPGDIRWVIMHQTSERSLLDGARAINKAFKRKICTKQNTINNLDQRGNTASTSHFVAIWDNILNGQIQSGDNVVFGITGSGQTIGTGLYTFDDLPDRIRKRKSSGGVTEKIFSTPRSDSPVELPKIRIASVGVFTPEKNGTFDTMSMVKSAVQQCIQKSAYDLAEIELVLFAGVYRTDFISEPALASMIAGELKINDAINPSDTRQTLAFDVINGGLSCLTACDIASQMIRSGKIRAALVIASEVENNRDQYPGELLGIKETASAMILDHAVPLKVGFGEFVFKYLPERLDARTVTAKYTNAQPRVCLAEDSAFWELCLSIIPDAVGELLKREGLAMKDISVVLPPQFSGKFLDELAKSLDFDRNLFVDLTGDGLDWFTSSLPGSLHAIESTSGAKPGDIGLAINVGSGLQVGCAIYRF